MITRRRFLANSSTFAIATLGAAEALAQGGGLAQSGLVGTLEGSQVVTDPAQWPEELQGGAGARRAGQAGQAAAGRAAPARRSRWCSSRLKRDRQVRRHLAARLLGPGRRRERQPHQRLRQAPVLGLHRHQDHARRSPRAWEMSDDGKTITRHAAQGHEVVRRRAVHRRRFRVLVRGHLRQQGHRADRHRRHVAQRQARARS